MKPARIALYLASAGLVAACGYMPPKEGEQRAVTRDYTVTGHTDYAKAYVYGNATLLEFPTAPAFVAVRNEDGSRIDYEKDGRYYRLPRIVDNFTVWINGSAVTFNAVTTTHVFQSSIRPAAHVAPKLAAVKPKPHLANKPVAVAKAAPVVPHRRIEDAPMSGIMQVSFGEDSTAFKPSPAVAASILASARSATLIRLRGRTDADQAGPGDKEIALGRAMAAREFLVTHGISPAKIRVFWRSAGDHVADNTTSAGKAANRRVQFEFVGPSQAGKDAGDSV